MTPVTDPKVLFLNPFGMIVLLMLQQAFDLLPEPARREA